jgi:hypothetical protein
MRAKGFDCTVKLLENRSLGLIRSFQVGYHRLQIPFSWAARSREEVRSVICWSKAELAEEEHVFGHRETDLVGTAEWAVFSSSDVSKEPSGVDLVRAASS